MLKYTHGNRNGTGSQMLVDVKINESGTSGIVAFKIKPQTDEKAGPRHFFAEEGSVSIGLDAGRISHVLGVLRGDTDSTLGDKGVSVSDGNRMAVIHVDALKEPVIGFAVHIVNTNEDTELHGRIILNPSEGLALLTAIEASMGKIAFGNK